MRIYHVACDNPPADICMSNLFAMHTTNEAEKNEERIDVLSDSSIHFWINELRITEQQLRNAVFIAGPLVKDVIAYLKRHGLMAGA
ncbi:MAG TPA: DUF3606 domain-containing protein [Flavisolibacter sp.]|nr:DUF3606 domain-containing protein [Flavisolibacter sp.]